MQFCLFTPINETEILILDNDPASTYEPNPAYYLDTRDNSVTFQKLKGKQVILSHQNSGMVSKNKIIALGTKDEIWTYKKGETSIVQVSK